MAKLRLTSIIGYITLSVLGLMLVLGVTTGAFGQLFNLLAAIAGIAFIITAAHGLSYQQALREQPGYIRTILGIGIMALLAFAVLMTFIVIALKNFS